MDILFFYSVLIYLEMKVEGFVGKKAWGMNNETKLNNE